LATDIDPNAIKSARIGEYDTRSLVSVPVNILRKYFHYDATKEKYIIKNRIKKIVRFKVHDVTKTPPISCVDAVFCRYVLIYITKEVQLHVLSNFNKALNNEGYLILGASEFLPEKAQQMFVTVNLRARIYKKRS